MSASRFTVDTNVLFYSLDSSADMKHERARLLMESAHELDFILTLQALGELFAAVAKRRRFSIALAEEVIQIYRSTVKIVPALESDLEDAIRAQQQHKIQFWDAMLWATARRAGCTLLLTEDFQNDRVLGGVTIRNPFLMEEKTFTALLS